MRCTPSGEDSPSRNLRTAVPLTSNSARPGPSDMTITVAADAAEPERIRKASATQRTAVTLPLSSSSAGLVLLDHRVRRVIVDRLEILRFHAIPLDARVAVEIRRDVAHHVLDELRVVVGALGDELLVGALE